MVHGLHGLDGFFLFIFLFLSFLSVFIRVHPCPILFAAWPRYVLRFRASPSLFHQEGLIIVNLFLDQFGYLASLNLEYLLIA